MHTYQQLNKLEKSYAGIYLIGESPMTQLGGRNFYHRILIRNKKV